ncbi:choice-of-anchor A family protein, partial [Methanosarcina sp. Z-7115]
MRYNMRHIILLIIGIFLLTIPVTASTNPFGTAENYNGFIFKNVLHNGGDVEGAFAVGGDTTLSSFGVGSSLPAGGNPAGIGMVVGGNSTWNNGELFHGNMCVGGTVSHTSVTIDDGVLLNPSTPINFTAEEIYLKSLSSYWASLPATPGTTVILQSWGRLDLTGTNSSLNVFFVSNVQWQGTGEIQLVVPSGSSVIINVEGTTDSLPHTPPGYFGNMNFNGNNGGNAWQTAIWNFYNMTNMSMSSVSWKGSLLAPYANFTYANGNVEGNLIAKSMTMPGSAELHLYPFIGDVPVPAVHNPKLTINKSASPANYSTARQTITYSYNVTNSGNVNIAGPITVTDNKVGTVNITAEDLIPGQSVIGTANYTITQSDLDNGSVTNSAFASGIFNGTVVNSTTVTTTVTANQTPGGSVTNSAFASGIFNGTVVNSTTVTITVTANQ